MNYIRKIEVKSGDVYMSCTRFGIPSENFKNEVLSNTYKSGGQPALDKAVISMLLNKLCPVELDGEDPSILPYKKALEAAEQQRILCFYQDRMNQPYQAYDTGKGNLDKSSGKSSLMKDYLSYRKEQTQAMLNAVFALVIR